MRRFPQMLILIGAFALGGVATYLVMHRRAGEPVSAMSATTPEKKALYWYDPMVPAQHFDHPGKSPFMDMQLVPKYTDEAAGPGVVQVDSRQVQNLGVRTAQAMRGALKASARVTGTVAFDERAVTVVQARVAGIVERLEVRAPLSPVTQGQPLLTLIAPDWTAAQEEYLALRRTHSDGLDDVRTAARGRLLLLGMTQAQIRAVEQTGRAQTRITVAAPQAGVVGELSVREGATVMAGAPLLRINGLDTVWVNAAIPEAQIGRVGTDAAVDAQLPAFPSEHFSGHIEALLADVDAVTRTQTARIVLKNPQHRLAPGMFAQLTIERAKAANEQVLVPTEAIIATGTRDVVIVADGKGRFRAQEVRIGDEADGKTQVLEGLNEGDAVVLSGQFLIDSEASLTGTLSRLAGGDDESKKPQPNGGTP